MNLEGITSNISKNIDKIGMIAGLFTGTPWNTAPLDVVQKALSGNIHLPDIPSAIGGFVSSGSLRNSLMAIIGGYAINEFAPSGMAKYGKMIEDLGFGYLEGSLIIWLAAAATNADNGSNPNSPNFNSKWYQSQGVPQQTNGASGGRGYEGY